MRSVYCAKCAFFAAYRAPWQDTVLACVAKAVVVTKGVITPTSDVIGVLDPRAKNKNNDCGDFRRFALATRKVFAVMGRAEDLVRIPVRKVNIAIEEDSVEEDPVEEEDDTGSRDGEAPAEPGGETLQPVG